MDNHPVDRGWSWVILLGCTVNMLLVMGSLKAFGIFFVEFLSVFEASVSVTSLISGLLQAVYSLVSLPVLTIGLRHLTVRMCILFGGCVVSAAYLLGSFAPNIEFLLFSNGLLFGFGFGFIHGPSTYVVGLYFEKRRNLACAIVVAGGSLGGLLLPPIYRLLLDTFGLQGALIVTSGLLLNIVVSASLLRPTSFYKSKNKKDDNSEIELEQQPLNSIEDEPRVRSQSFALGYKMRPMSAAKSKQEDKSLAELTRCKSDNIYYSNINNGHENLGTLKGSVIDRISQSSFVRYASKGDLYTASLSSLTSKPKNDNQESSIKKDIKTMVFKTITNDINFRLLKNPLIILFLISFSFGSVGVAYGHVFIAAFAKDTGVDDKMIPLIISIINGCDFAGRILSGVVSDFKIIRSHLIVASSMVICSLNMFLSMFYKDFWSIMIFSVVHGLFAGTLIALTPAVIIDFLGMKNYRTSMGMSLLFQGLTLSVSAPIIGVIRDFTGTYTSSFQFIGTCFLVSSLALYLEPCFRKYQLSDFIEQSTEIIVDVSDND